MDKYEQKKIQYEEAIQNKSEELENYFESTTIIQKNVENLHQILKQTEVKDNNKSLKNEVKELEKVIAEIEKEWGASKKEMVDSIEDFKNQVNEKKEKLD